MLPKLNIEFHGQSKSFKHWQNTWDILHTWQTSCCLWTCAHTYTLGTPTHTSQSSVRCAGTCWQQCIQSARSGCVTLCGTPGLHHLQCICYINLGTSLLPFPPPSLLQLLRFVLNVVLLKTNLLPIIKIRAKQTTKRKAKNSSKKTGKK